MSLPSAGCPRCGVPRSAGPECPACGVIYARAEARDAARQALAREEAAREAGLREAEDRRRAMRDALEAHGVPTFTSPLAAAGAGSAAMSSTDALALEDDPAAETRAEALRRLWVLPVALGVAWFAVRSPGLHGVLRIFLTMPVHELGHAVTAWFCGFSATPTLWVTHTSEDRSPFMFLVVAGLSGALAWRGGRQRQWGHVGVGVLLLTLLCGGTFGLGKREANALIFFGGDAGRMVLGALLMATFYVPPPHYLRRHALRWGFLGIGAAALMDSFEQWWAARTDVDRIPFGAIEGVGLSDPSALVQRYGWNVSRLIHWNVGVGVACLVALGALYVGALWRDRALLRGPGAA